MNFISYAQNHEDVMLYRALREVKHGFYVDVGAQDPIIDSVTKAFYERGWRGINIEPDAEYFHKLEDDRPHDVNLLTAVGCEPGVIPFYNVARTGLSTTSEVYARRHKEAGYDVNLITVPCTTLDRICTDGSVETVHFLKIDVEGSERAVLEGFSFEAVRPWIVVVEATEPNSNRKVFAQWEDLLLKHLYQFEYFDGLNRFYIAAERAELARHFSCPPNPFDQYVSYHLWWARESLQAQAAKLDAQVAGHDAQAAEHDALVNSLKHVLAEAESLRDGIFERDTRINDLRDAAVERGIQIESLRNAIVERERRVEEIRSTLMATERRLRSVRSSVSWRLTSPLREIRRVAVRVASLVGRAFGSQHASQEAREPLLKVQGPLDASPAGLVISDEIAAGLTEPARPLYRALRERVAREP
jgi:FkbM family methyltransferase